MSDVTVTNEADAVRQAARWADALLAKFYHGPRDNVDAAMHRAEAAYGIPAGTFWSLRYRPPKLMGVAAWFHIKAIYDATCAAQEARVRHDLDILKALPRNPARQALIDEAEAALGVAAGQIHTIGHEEGEA